MALSFSSIVIVWIVANVSQSEYVMLMPYFEIRTDWMLLLGLFRRKYQVVCQTIFQ